MAVDALCHALAKAGYPADYTRDLYQGFTLGFDLGIGQSQSGTYPTPGSCQNPPPLSSESWARVHKHLLDEVAVGRRLGPFPGRPEGLFWTGARVSPLSEIPKGEDSGKFRLIFNLSYGGSCSVNSSIPEELGSVVYPSFEDVVQKINAVGVGRVWFGLHDVVDAFRHLPIRQDQWKYLVSSWPSANGKQDFFVDTCLCFGVRTGPSIYHKFGAAVEFLLVKLAGCEVIRMTDDHMFLAISAHLLEMMLGRAERLFGFLRIPWSLPKRVGATRACKFLGYWWDAEADLVSLHPSRVTKMLVKLEALMIQPWVCAHDVRKLVGLLVWASKVLPYGRIMNLPLHRALARAGATSVRASMARTIYFQLDSDAMDSVIWWITLCHRHQSSPRTVGRKISTFFLPPPTPLVTAHCDASGVALGGWVGRDWFQVKVPDHITVGAGVNTSGPPAGQVVYSSTLAEAAGALATVLIFGDAAANSHMLIKSDSNDLVEAWRTGSTRAPGLARYLAAIALACSHRGIVLTLEHIMGVENGIADAISRSLMQRFRALHPMAALLPLREPSADQIWLW